MEKFSEKIKKFFSSEASLQRIPLYFFLTCVLLVVLIFKLGETNQCLKEIAKNGTEVIQIETKDNNDVADVFIESTESAEDIVPILGEITSTETTTEKSKETTTKKDSAENSNTTTQSPSQNNEDNSDKTTYVLNISSKKIHLPDCSFVSRTKEENKREVNLTEEELQEYLDNGYSLCKTCGGI